MKKTTKLEAELKMWEGIFDRHPEVFKGEINDLRTIPKDLLSKLAKKFDFVKRYIKKNGKM